MRNAAQILFGTLYIISLLSVVKTVAGSRQAFTTIIKSAMWIVYWFNSKLDFQIISSEHSYHFTMVPDHFTQTPNHLLWLQNIFLILTWFQAIFFILSWFQTILSFKSVSWPIYLVSRAFSHFSMIPNHFTYSQRVEVISDYV